MSLAGDFPDVDQVSLRGTGVILLRLGAVTNLTRVLHHVMAGRDVLGSKHSPMMDLTSDDLQVEPGVIRIDFALAFDPLAHCLPT